MNIILIISLLLNASIAFAQTNNDCELFARYEFTWLKDTVHLEYNYEDYNLVKTHNHVYFFNSAHEHNDSIYTAAGYNMSNYTDREQSKRWRKDWNEGRFASFIKIPLSELIYFSEMQRKTENYVRFRDMGKPQYYSLSIDIPSWDIANESDTLMGLEVIQAKTNYGGRNYIAWFAPSIPINEGPYVFRGLPGLILKVTDDENKYSFELIQYKKNVDNCFIPFEVDWVHKRVSYDEWVQVRKECYYNPRMVVQIKEQKENYRKYVLNNSRYLLLER
ncbi:MAG TPA: GLPGLI family protein [Saprospiraceae bacterium]|nr:GLPGLI family protein [Saprospiraceae bacterium]